MLLVFMLFALIMSIGSDFMNFLHVDTLQNAIASKIRESEGFMTLVWYLACGLPYIFAIGLVIGLYEWIRARFHDYKGVIAWLIFLKNIQILFLICLFLV